MGYSEYQFHKDLINSLNDIAKQLSRLNAKIDKLISSGLQSSAKGEEEPEEIVICPHCDSTIAKRNLEILWGGDKVLYICPECGDIVEERKGDYDQNH